jgi:hypothetical protein
MNVRAVQRTSPNGQKSTSQRQTLGRGVWHEPQHHLYVAVGPAESTKDARSRRTHGSQVEALEDVELLEGRQALRVRRQLATR